MKQNLLESKRGIRANPFEPPGRGKADKTSPNIEAITTINELEGALCKAAGTTPKEVEAAKINILKQQLEVSLTIKSMWETPHLVTKKDIRESSQRINCTD